MKLGKAISWFMRTLQDDLFPRLEESWRAPLTDKQPLVSILDFAQVDKLVPRRSDNQWLRRRLRAREPIRRSLVAKAAYGYPCTLRLIEVFKTAPNLRRICGFDKVSDISSESTLSKAFREFAESRLGTLSSP